MMQPQYHQQMMVPMGNDCNHGSMEGCAIPQPSMENMGEYLEQQMQQQQYETQAMSEKIKAQFEGMVEKVTMRKHRYVMSLVTEFVSFCECARSSGEIYNALFVQSARALNLTDMVEVYDNSRMPYQAKSEEEARMLVFGGLVTKMCESAGTFLTFADSVSQRITAIQAGQGKK